MTIDVQTEELLTLREAASAFPGKKKLGLATLFRWIASPGVRGAVLETVTIGRARYTSRQAIARFIAAQNQSKAVTPGITPDQRRRQSAAARRELERSGV